MAISGLLKKVGALSPKEYTWSLSYKEKLDLLLYLVDTIHDMDSFRQHLNKRLEDKSKIFKQKNDIHAEIKKIEQDKNDAMQKYNSENQESNENLESEIEKLKEQLMCATRTESKWINGKIQELMKQKNKFADEMFRFDDQINRKHQKIDKLMESYHCLNIRTSVLGQDKHMSEYWFFKDDPHRLYVKKLATKESMGSPANVNEESVDG
jgi:chromosome segregation ATPase